MTIKIGGVPEHFNFPWHYGLQKGLFSKAGVPIEWVDFPGGTGAMAAALQNNDLDIAVLLTEGAIKEISNGAHFKIVKTFVQSPLIWGIHTSIANKKASIGNLSAMKYAISRWGSGSHLMSFVHAKDQGQIVKDEQMVVVNDLSGALNSLKGQQTDLFFWEKFTTKPYVDNGELVRLGEFPTPWPCFMVVAHEQLLLSKKDVLDKILSVLDKCIHEVLSDMATTQESIVEKYSLPQSDVASWLQQTCWSITPFVSKNMLFHAQQALEALGLAKKIATDQLVYDQKILN